MRAYGPLLLLNAALVAWLCVGLWSASSAPRLSPPLVSRTQSATTQLAPVQHVAIAPPAPAEKSTTPVRTPPPIAAAVARPPQPRHEALAERAAAGDADAALELANMLEACTTRDETRGMMSIIVHDTGSAPDCTSRESCATVERLYDEFERSMAHWRDADLDCRQVPRSWLDTRGRWLQRAAELGDDEAMACYALTGVELAPSSFHPGWAPWMEHWRQHALAWAWQAWDRGEPRAAVALARIYATSTNLRDNAALTDSNPRLNYRFALLLTRALDLDPGENDLAASVETGAEQFTPSQLADEEAWVEAQLPRLKERLALPSRTPDDCWQHFGVFESRPKSAALDASTYSAMR